MDGAMGTQLVGLVRPGQPVELLNLDRPDAVMRVHADYISAGAEAILTNTFGANPIKLALSGHEGYAREINAAAVRIAMRAREESGHHHVAVIASMGPTGRLLTPAGDLDFDDAYQAYRFQARALAEAGVDGVLVETMSDIVEARAAVLACKDEGLPVAATMTFDGELTSMGVSPECAAIVLQSLGALAVGANCSTGPEGLAPVLRKMLQVVRVPLLARPNAGIPGKNELSSVAAWCQAAAQLLDEGVSVIGGCCGTSPRHVATLRSMLDEPAGRTSPDAAPAASLRSSGGTNGGEGMLICGFRKYARILLRGYPCLVGERINPSRKRALREDILSSRMEVVRSEARWQAENGADALDLSADIPGSEVSKSMVSLVQAVQSVWDGPCLLDSASANCLEAAAVRFRGRPLLNSLRFEEPAFTEGVRMARRVGASAVLLLSGPDGTPPTVEGRLKMAEDMALKARRLGLDTNDLLIDPAVSPVATEPEGPLTFARCVAAMGERGWLTCGGLSNVSHGLPARPVLNGAFISAAVCAGLNAVIADPCDRVVREAIAAGALLAGRDPNARRYLSLLGGKGQERRSEPESDSALDRLRRAVLEGNSATARELVLKALEDGASPMDILDTGVTAAMAEAGRLFDEKVFFVPNLLLAAEAAKACLELLRPKLGKQAGGRGVVAMATVEGDIHDVGKNIVCAVLESRGFEVKDLGKSVPVEKVLEVLQSVDIVGLSSLMTTTLPAMERTLKAAKARRPSVKVIVGGGVLTPEYAASIGADGYAENAAAAAELVSRLLKEDYRWTCDQNSTRGSSSSRLK